MDLIISVIFIVAGIGLIFITGRNYLQSNIDVRDFIITHYRNENMIINKISELNFTEKLKYRVPFLKYLNRNDLYSTILNSPKSYNRKVELTDKDGNEFTKYVEIIVKDRNVISFKEYDSYDI